MASMSFTETAPEKEQNETATETIETTSLAVAPTAPTAIYVEGEDAEGEFSSRDFQSPPLTLVTKTSADAETYGIGTWLVNKETPVGKMTEPLPVIAVKIQKAFQEQLPFGTGQRPRMFRTSAEVHEAGLSLEWGAEARAAEVLGVRFWLPQPADVDAPHVFTMESPEGMGTIVKFFAARTTYGTVGKTLIDASQRFLRPEKGGLATKWWEMTATKEAKNGNTWLLPRIKPGKAASPEMAEFLKSIRV
jgi:hypothetical protein